MERLRAELRDRPDVSTQALQEVAADIDPAIGELSRRQFNAGFVVPLKRGTGSTTKKAAGGKRAAERGGKEKKQQAAAPGRSTAKPPRAEAVQSARPGVDREQIRAVLLQFAQDFSQAETRFEIVNVLSDLDRYVDRIVAAKG